MKSIAIIPARGGSKRIPGKNIRDFLGKPIIAYSIEAALGSGVFDEVMVSTDDDAIASIADKHGAKVPFMRSLENSTDFATTLSVLVEVVSIYKELGREFGFGSCIYPCAPFVTAESIREGMEVLKESGAYSVIPAARFPTPPQWGMAIRDGRLIMLEPENANTRSQDLEPLYYDPGQFYCFRVDILNESDTLFTDNTMPLIIRESEVQDIDTEEDWAIAEMKYEILQDRRRRNV